MADANSKQSGRAESTPPRQRGQTPTKPRAETEPRHIDVMHREYDLDVIENFLDMVFHSELNEGEETMVWTVPRYHKPVYPITEQEMFDKLARTKSARALYFGTATTHRNQAGELRNQQSLFERLHVIVLDDIGTKARAEDLPGALQTPTYIMETSQGNFQYGYVLETPIDNLDAAKALVMIMYEAGIADAGGKMPNKLVRLPEGVNGKKGEKGGFVTRLTATDGPRWSPQALLDALGTGGDWAEIEADAAEATKRRVRLKGGSTPWGPYRPTRPSMSGIIDPVAEWLEERGDIVTESGDWLTVKCPWSDFHTSGNDTAGYKPLGVGDEPNRRVFHCFHDACAAQHTPDYLNFIVALGGPAASVKDDVAELVSSYVFDMVNNCAWKIKDTADPKMVSIDGMRNAFPRSSLVPGLTPTGKPTVKTVSEFTRWLTSESRVTVHGPRFDPTNPARLVADANGDLFVNQFAPPVWGDGAFDKKDVNTFVDFIEYLIPEPMEREYFLDWLAAKFQNMGFRGAAIIMVAQRQGIGRGTLIDMIKAMLGDVNLRYEPFDKVIGDHQFNDWMESPMVVSNETLDDGGLSTYKTYERLKEIVDPRPVMTTINPKYGKARRTMVHSSFIFLSNHSNALSLPEDDRRCFVISNPHTPRPPEYFIELDKWMTKGEWARNVYRWLRQRKVNLTWLLAPPASTAAKREMVQESRSDIDTVAQKLFAYWPCEYITAKQFNSTIERFADRLELYDMRNYKAQLKRIFSAATYPLSPGAVVKIDGHSHRPKVILSRVQPGTAEKGAELSNADKSAIRSALIAESIATAVKNVAAALDEIGL